jgi:hypothetical protein
VGNNLQITKNLSVITGTTTIAALQQKTNDATLTLNPANIVTVAYNANASGTTYFLPKGIAGNYTLHLQGAPTDANTQYTVCLVNNDSTTSGTTGATAASYLCTSVLTSTTGLPNIFFPVDVMMFTGIYVSSPQYSIQTIDFMYQDNALYALSTVKQYSNTHP